MKCEFYGRVKRIEYTNQMGEFKVESSVKFNDNTYGIAFNFNQNNVKQIGESENSNKSDKSENDNKSGESANSNNNASNVIIVPQQLKLVTFFDFISAHSNSRFLIEFDNGNNTITKVVLCND